MCGLRVSNSPITLLSYNGLRRFRNSRQKYYLGSRMLTVRKRSIAQTKAIGNNSFCIKIVFLFEVSVRSTSLC